MRDFVTWELGYNRELVVSNSECGHAMRREVGRGILIPEESCKGSEGGRAKVNVAGTRIHAVVVVVELQSR